MSVIDALLDYSIRHCFNSSTSFSDLGSDENFPACLAISRIPHDQKSSKALLTANQRHSLSCIS